MTFSTKLYSLLEVRDKTLFSKEEDFKLLLDEVIEFETLYVKKKLKASVE